MIFFKKYVETAERSDDASTYCKKMLTLYIEHFYIFGYAKTYFCDFATNGICQ